MKFNKFDVVELKNGNRATILEINKHKYLAEIVNAYGITLDTKEITNEDITKIICSKGKNNLIK